MKDFLADLNEQQREAVLYTDGPTLILAGAGTGKTKVLTSKIAYLIAYKKIDPLNILCVTFTNKAANEMKRRIENMVGVLPARGYFGTFHAICAKILRSHAYVLGYKNNFNIIDQSDQLRLIKNLLKFQNLDIKQYPPRYMLYLISKFKDNALDEDSVKTSPRDNVIKKLYIDYQKALLTANSMDFGDLIFNVIKLFWQDKSILKYYQDQFEYILVDEYQDTNHAQYLFLRHMTEKNHKISVVGDDDQSIFSWRGANVNNILSFKDEYVKTKVIKLKLNYRSTNNILKNAISVISQNSFRMDKELTSHIIGNDGEAIKLIRAYANKDEAEFVAQTILKQSDDHSLSEMAILIRASFQSRGFEEALITHRIPYKIYSGSRFYDREEIKDATSYLRLLSNEQDDLAFERIINKPARGVGIKTMEIIRNYAKIQQTSLFDATRQLLKAGGFKRVLSLNLVKFITSIDEEKNINLGKPRDVLERLLDKTSYIGFWKKDLNIGPGKLENIKELYSAMSNFSTIEDFLEHISLVLDLEETENRDDMVNIMTLHAAKGLEFDIVFLPGWEEGIFPNQKTLDENSKQGLEEERRLAYVGMTRAKYKLYISYTIMRQMYGRWNNTIPSRFIKELHDQQQQEKMPVRKHYNSSYGSRRSPYDRKQNNQNTSIELGKKCQHDKFGTGVVVDLNGDYATVMFSNSGLKTVSVHFLHKI